MEELDRLDQSLVGHGRVPGVVWNEPASFDPKALRRRSGAPRRKSTAARAPTMRPSSAPRIAIRRPAPLYFDATFLGTGVVAAPLMNRAIKPRPLGRYVPPSAAAAALAFVAMALAHRGGHRKTKRAAALMGIGLTIGTAATPRDRGGII